MGVKKLVAQKNDPSVIPQLIAQGYDHVSLFFAGHPRHVAAGLREDCMLVHAWRFKQRPDRRGVKIR